MKKILFLSMLAALVALSSCSKSEDAPLDSNDGSRGTTFTLRLPEAPPAARAGGNAPTRAAVSDLTRYIVEAYEGKDLTKEPQRMESDQRTLTVFLKKSTEYTFLFWADQGTAATESAPSSGYYDAANLRAVKVATAANAGERAYCLAMSFNSDDFDKNGNSTPILKNAVASVVLVQSGGDIVTTDNTVKITYPDLGTFNVADGVVTPNEVAAPVTRSFAVTAATGVIATDYVLADATKALADLTVQFNSETAKAITNVPLQCNYKTSITGEYSNIYASAFTVSSDVENYTDQEKPLEIPTTKTITIDGVAFDFVLVKAGTFQIGTPGATNEEVPCWVQISKDYYIGKTEVTQAQYQKITGSNPSEFNGSTGYEAATDEIQANRPVETVTWDAICTGTESFLAKINALDAVKAAGIVRLPSEAQWEYAARGGHKAGAFMQWSGTDTEGELGDYAWFTTNAGSKTHEVGKKSPNLLGVHDMAGNVMEWCSSYYTDNYPTGTTEENPAVDPDENTTGTHHALRGGAYFNDASYCRSAIRFYNPTGYGNHIGFRLVLVPKVQP